MKERLKHLPDGMEVITDEHSDYAPVNFAGVVKAVPQSGGWTMRSHDTMSDENKAHETYVLRIATF